MKTKHGQCGCCVHWDGKRTKAGVCGWDAKDKWAECKKITESETSSCAAELSCGDVLSDDQLGVNFQASRVFGCVHWRLA